MDYEAVYYRSPKQSNTSDCGVFSIVNMLFAFDKEKDSQRANKFSPEIIT